MQNNEYDIQIKGNAKTTANRSRKAGNNQAFDSATA
jgi:hypothetical protein